MPYKRKKEGLVVSYNIIIPYDVEVPKNLCKKYMDDILWFLSPNMHKYYNTKALEENVEEKDTVVIIGGGHGITSVAAAKNICDSGKIIIYEATERRLKDIRRTMRLNNVERKNHEIIHAAVGNADNVVGNKGDASIMSPMSIPKCDVLEIDCEGSEINVLKALNQKPRVIVVETHPSRGAYTQLVKQILADMDYTTNKIGRDPGEGDIVVAF